MFYLLVVGGFATLTKLQNIPTTKNDVPKEDIEILECIVYEDPFEDYFQEEQVERIKHSYYFASVFFFCLEGRRGKFK
jgi:hypothetical protein